MKIEALALFPPFRDKLSNNINIPLAETIVICIPKQLGGSLLSQFSYLSDERLGVEFEPIC